MEQFKRMKGTAWLINAARGELVKEKELIGALSQGVIAGAALDVFEKEPPKKDSGRLTFVVREHGKKMKEKRGE